MNKILDEKKIYNKYKESINNCYICLEQIDYFYCFDCQCYNFIHMECIKKTKIDKCVICKRKILLPNKLVIDDSSPNYNLNFNHPVLFDFAVLNGVLNFLQLHNLLDLHLSFLQKNNNIYGLIVWIGVSFTYTFLLMVPLLIISFLCNVILVSKIYIMKINLLELIKFLVILAFVISHIKK